VAVSATRILAIILVVAGVLGLVYGGFDYFHDSHEAKLGSLEFAIRSRHTLVFPTWASVGAICVGVVLLLLGRSKP
jgi:TRAP-type C4-dicarboxylate transport system permease small subunit